MTSGTANSGAFMCKFRKLEWLGIEGKRALRSKLLIGGALSLLVQLQFQIVRLLSGVIVARALGPVRFGIYAFTMAVVTLLQIIPAYGLDGTVIRYSSEYRTRESWAFLRGLWRTALMASVVYGVVAVAAVLGVLSLGWLNATAAFSPSVLSSACVLILFMPTMTYLSAALRTVNPGVLGQLPQFAIQPWIFLILAVGVMITARSVMSPEFAVFLQGTAAAATVFVGLGLLKKNRPTSVLRAKPDLELKRWFRSASSFCLLGGLELINTQTDVLMLGTLGSAHDTGIFRVAANGANLLGLSVAAVNLYIGPKIPELYARGEIGRLQKLLSYCARGAFGVSLLAASLFLFFGSDLLRVIFGVAYTAAFWPLMILCIGQLSSVGAGFGGLLLSMTGHERDAAIIAGIAAAFNIGLNAFLIPRFGVLGCAVASASTMLLWRSILLIRAKGRTGVNVSIFPARVF